MMVFLNSVQRYLPQHRALAFTAFSSQNRQRTFRQPTQKTVNLAKAYALRVPDQSMANAGIPEGSIVLCQSTALVENGELAVVLFEGEGAIIRRIQFIDDIWILHPENPAFQDTIVRGKKKLDSVRIIGKCLFVVNAVK
jgi:SOS-response transcriptional repressor LexA